MIKQQINLKEVNQVYGRLLSDGDISIRIERNVIKIKDIILNKDLKQHLISEPKKLINELNKFKSRDYFAYIIQENGKDFGIVTLEYLKKVKLGMVEVGILKEYRGLKAKKGINLIIKHIYKKNPTIRLLGKIKKDNRKSYFFSKLFGFHLKSQTSSHYIVMR